MKSILNDGVLLLHKNMGPLRVISVRKAMFLMAKPRSAKDPSSKRATALEVSEDHEIIGPVSWEDWIAQEPKEGDRVIHTAKRAIKVPSIIVLSDFDHVPIVDPMLTKRNLWKRQKGRDMYDKDAHLEWDKCNIDHYIARDKGGKTEWTNVGLTTIEKNQKKANKRAEEVGLRLQLPLTKPRPKPTFVDIQRDPRFPEWDYFLKT